MIDFAGCAPVKYYVTIWNVFMIDLWQPRIEEVVLRSDTRMLLVYSQSAVE